MEDNYNIMMVFAIHGLESAMGAHVSPHPEPPFYLPPHPISLGCPRALTLNALLHAWNLHWSSILHTRFNAILSNHPTLAFSLRDHKYVLYTESDTTEVT